MQQNKKKKLVLLKTEIISIHQLFFVIPDSQMSL